MTNSHGQAMNCDLFADKLADFLERDLPESARASMETHALSCGDCGPLLADLRKLQVDAANMAELMPSRDLWSGIAARIETPVVELGARSGGWTGSRERRPYFRIGLAAAGLVAVTATSTYLLTMKSVRSQATTPVAAAPSSVSPSATVAVLSSPPAVSDSASSPSVRTAAEASAQAAATRRISSAQPASPLAAPSTSVSFVSNRLTAEQTFGVEIARLRVIVKQRRTELDSSTVAVLEKNLKIIDNAIAQCRIALKEDPASDFLLESLNQALNNKVQLLRTAAGLPSRM